jgi:hypothetical protein
MTFYLDDVNVLKKVISRKIVFFGVLKVKNENIRIRIRIRIRILRLEGQGRK